MEVTLSVTRQHHILFLPCMFSLSNPRPGFMPFLIRACHHQNGHFLAQRHFINFLFTSAVAQSARLRAESLSPEGQKPACGAEASTRSARACRGTCYPGNSPPPSFAAYSLLCVQLSPTLSEKQRGCLQLLALVLP